MSANTELLRAPEGVELSMVFFITSDEIGVNTSVAIGGMPVLPGFPSEINALGLARSALGPLGKEVDDWRLMTREEIRAFKADEDRTDDEEEAW